MTKRPQILDSRNAEASGKLLAMGNSRRLSLQMFSGWTLPGMVEFFLFLQSFNEDTGHIWNEIESGDPAVEHWKTLHSVWSHCTPSTSLPTGVASSIEFFILDSKEILNRSSMKALYYSEFQQRFVKAAKLAGFSGRFPTALAAVMHEMVENVFQHSDLPFGSGGKGIIGVHVADDYVSFTVSDLGLGLLQSLRTSEEWSELNNDQAALEAIVRRRASRKQGLGEGEGFKQLFCSLVDRNAVVRIRSGSAVFILAQDGHTRQGTYAWSTELGGLQISLVCSRLGKPVEREIL